MSVRVMISIWLSCVLAGAGLSSGVLAGDALTGDRSVRSPTICPSGIFIDPATLHRTDIPDAAGFDTDAAGRGFVFSDRPGDTNDAHSTMRARGCELREARRGLLQNSDDQCWMRFGSSDLRPWRGGTVAAFDVTALEIP